MIKCQQGVKERNGNAIICQPRTPNQQNVKPVEITKSGGHCSDEILYLDIKEVKIPKGKY